MNNLAPFRNPSINRYSTICAVPAFMLWLLLSSCGTSLRLKETKLFARNGCACEKIQQQAEKEYRDLEKKKRKPASPVKEKLLQPNKQVHKPLLKRSHHFKHPAKKNRTHKGWKAKVKNKLVRCPAF